MALEKHNLLAQETSPYLLQHRDNPVHWRPWCSEALAEAAALDRPILLSIGYAACHWCHVMAHESFEDPDVAAVMNELFVNIKVDREERPDLDQIYMAALSATGEQGGWPLTMFLTPAGKPFWGGTYFPKTARFGRPGFVDVLRSVASAWKEKTDQLLAGAETLTRHVSDRLAVRSDPAGFAPAILTDYADRIFRLVDPIRGGLRGAPKFPNAPMMRTLWLSWLHDARSTHRDAVLVSLAQMLKGGIYDHLGGGLSRYSTDADWAVPHFEKMLYDNAQLLELCGWAYAARANPLFRARIEETVAFLQRDMTLESGAFASSLDADSEGEEGKYYTWTRSAIESVLPDRKSSEFLDFYELLSPDHWHGDPILALKADQALPDALFSDRFATIRRDLLAERTRRIPPGRDDKALVDWNGLAIAAIARASRQFGRAEWLEAAERAYRSVTESRAEDDRLPHSILGGRRLFPALSSDYAAMISAAVVLFETTGRSAYLDEARLFLDLLDRWHGDCSGTGHYLSSSDSSDVPIRIRGDVDEAVTSATGQIVEAVARLGAATGDHVLQERAAAMAEAALGRSRELAHGQAGILNAAMVAHDAARLVVIDAPSHQLGAIARSNPDPRRVDVHLPVCSTEMSQIAEGIALDSTRPGAWYCTGRTCLPPVDDPHTLARMLQPQPARD